MPWNDTTKQVEPLYAFLDQFQPGDPAMRSSFDAFLNDLITSVNAGLAYLEALAGGAIYLGESATPPTQRPDASPLVSGDFYLDTDDGILYRYDEATDSWFPIVPPSGASAFVTSEVLPAESAAALRAVLELGTAATADAGAFQPLNSKLTSFASLSPVADRLPYFTGASTIALATLTSFARTLLDDGSASTARATLGLGAVAVLNTIATAQIDNSAVTTAKLASGERMTTANVLAMIAAAGPTDVGMFGFLERTSGNSVIAAGATYAGSGLRWSGVRLEQGGPGASSGFNDGAIASGTWRALGSVSDPASGQASATLFLRIA